MNYFVRAAHRCYYDNGRVGAHTLIAIAVDANGEVLAKGLNSYSKTHPMQAEYAKKIGRKDAIFLHAEIAALVKCRKDPYIMYIFRFDKKGKTRLSKPCKICMLAMKEAGIEKIVYTNDHNGFTVEDVV